MHNYRLLDEKFHYQQRQERLEAAQALGFEYISESIVKTYRAYKSSTKTGALLGGLSAQAILQFLGKVGEPVNSKGGWNRSRQRKWEIRRNGN